MASLDTFNYIISVLLIIMAIQFDQLWIAFGVFVIMILSFKSVLTTFLFFVTLVVLMWLGKENILANWPLVVFGLVILSLLINMRGGQEEGGGGGFDLSGLGGGLGGMG